MLLNHMLLSFLVFISPVFPPVFIPIAYTLIGVRLLQGSGPVGLSFSTVIPAAVSSILVRLLYGYAHRWILRFKTNRENKDWISCLENRFAKYIENKKRLSKINKRITNFLETKNSKLVLFLLTIVAIDSAIPDIVAIGIVRKRLPFPLFVLASIIGKATVYLPVIWGAKRILQLFGN